MMPAHASSLPAAVDQRRMLPPRRLDRIQPATRLPQARAAAQGLDRALVLAVPLSGLLWLSAGLTLWTVLR